MKDIMSEVFIYAYFLHEIGQNVGSISETIISHMLLTEGLFSDNLIKSVHLV